MLIACVEQSSATWNSVITEFALARISATAGATHSELVRDLGAYFAHKLSPSEFRAGLDDALADAEDCEFCHNLKGRYRLTELGRAHVRNTYATPDLPDEWADMRDQQVTAAALGKPDLPATRKKLLAKPDGLRMAIVQKAFDLRLRRMPTPARVRAALAGIALKQAFGGKLGPDFSVDGGVDANASRSLAGHLLRKPRDFNSDSQLIGALAADAIGAAQSDVTTLRLVLFRHYISGRVAAVGFDDGRSTTDSGGSRGVELLVEALGDPIASPLQRPGQSPNTRPDIEEFAAVVRDAADASAQGWSGNRKAFISHVWQAVCVSQGKWALSEIEFKSMLTEAHRAGHITLASADLKSKSDLPDFQASEINYKNTIWHFVRLDT